MNDREREAYLNRIGYEGELRTDKKCLEKIMDLHLCSICLLYTTEAADE